MTEHVLARNMTTGTRRVPGGRMPLAPAPLFRPAESALTSIHRRDTHRAVEPASHRMVRGGNSATQLIGGIS
jgi:hypothetical protein